MINASFTGSIGQKFGRFKLADKERCSFDEVGDITFARKTPSQICWWPTANVRAVAQLLSRVDYDETLVSRKNFQPLNVYWNCRHHLVSDRLVRRWTAGVAVWVSLAPNTEDLGYKRGM
jgi:hypothetical protein